MISAIDIGNSLVKVGFFEGGELRDIRQFSVEAAAFYQALSGQSLGHTVTATVRGLPEHLLSYLKSKSETFLLLDTASRLPFANRYETPETLGPDRLALAAGAWERVSKESILVIGMGTCITYTFVSRKDGLLGGAISPGLEMRLEAMHRYTGRLPRVHIGDEQVEVLGKNTTQSLQSGALVGMAAEVDGMVSRYAEYGKTRLKIFLAGGDAPRLSPLLQTEHILEPQLALYGLRLLLQLNEPRAK